MCPRPARLLLLLVLLLSPSKRVLSERKEVELGENDGGKEDEGEEDMLQG